MKTILIASLFASFTFVSSGCVVHSQEKRPQASERSRQPKNESCRPSHDWDAKQQKCVHRGKGKGARKHDY